MIKFTRGFSIVLLILLFVPAASAEEGNLEFAMDHAQFRLQDDYAYLEVYYSITRNSITFNQEDSAFNAGVIIKTYLQQDSVAMLVDSLMILDEVTSMKQISSTQKFTEMSRLQVEKGAYVLVSQLTDMNSGKSVSVSDSLVVRSFTGSGLSMSDIQFATSLSAQPEAVWKFDKNGMRVMPNAAKTFGTGSPKLYFYSEIYNLSTEDASSTYRLVYSVMNDQGDIVMEMRSKPRKKPGASSIANGGIDIDQLRSGTYAFKVQVIDNDTQEFASAEKIFNIFRLEDLIAKEDDADQLIASTTDEFAAMSEDQLDDYVKKIRYIMLKDERNIFKKLDVNGKRNFLNEFWKSRDPDPRTPVNEKKVQYFDLLEFSNLNFTVGGKAGWKTDRARVLLMYGQPDDVEYHPSSNTEKAHQIWRYDYLEGGVVFVFVDLRQFGDYQLVHSTYRDEVQQYQWKEVFVPMGQSAY